LTKVEESNSREERLPYPEANGHPKPNKKP
jgi:hypothetical protein